MTLSHSLTPEVHHAADVEEGEDDGEEDLEARDQAGQHQQRRHEDAGERQHDVAVQLVHNDLEGRNEDEGAVSTLRERPMLINVCLSNEVGRMTMNKCNHQCSARHCSPRQVEEGAFRKPP